jgi:ribosomal protein S18 acetylase RimI-like enzyme
MQQSHQAMTEIRATKLLFTSTNEPAQAMVLRVDAGLEQHNQAAAPLADVKPLATFATTALGEVVGGAVGRTWGRCCELLQLWVEPALRARGVGSELLQRFEAHGEARNCNVFYLTTLSFQAPAFYRKHGYQVLTEIDGYPNGIVKYLMHKVTV